MNRSCVAFIILAAVAVWPEPLAAQARPSATAEPRWREARTWRQSDGLPQDSVISLLQTRDGYLWIGTRGGVSRFDGVRFTTFDDRDKNQLRENEVWGLAEGDDGALWIGVYGGGLSRLHRGVFTVFGAKEGLADEFVRVLAKDAYGSIWIGTDRGLSRFKDGAFTHYTTKDGLLPGPVRALLAEAEGGVLLATSGGLQRVRAGVIEVVAVPGMDAKLLGAVEALCRDREDGLWLGTSSGLVRVAGGKAVRYTTADGLSSNVVRRLHQDGAGRLWVATLAGVDRVVAGSVSAGTSSVGAGTGSGPGAGSGSAVGASAGFRFVTEVVANDVTALHSDREGGLWVGHRGAGLARHHQGVFSTSGLQEGLPSLDLTTVLNARNGAAWIGSSAGLTVLHDGRFMHLLEANGLPNTSVQALAEDAKGYLWVGTERGLFRSNEPNDCASGGRCMPRFHALREDAILSQQVRTILQDRSGALWIGTDRSGLAKYDSGQVTRFTTADGLSNDSIRALAETKDGSLWVGTKGGGLNRLKDGAFQVFGTGEGLPNNSVQALYADANDALWIATRQGTSRYKDGRFTTYSVKDGMYWSHVYSFLEDDLGNLWMTSGKGVFRVSKRQLDDFAEGKVRSVTSTVYNREHGLPSSMAAVGSSPGASKSADGRVWFAVVGGLTVADPRHLPINGVPPPVHLEEVKIDAKVFDPRRPVEAEPGRGDFCFRYAALSFEAPLAVRTRYRLEGFDADWVDATTRGVATYTNLPPGRYRFRVIAANNDGVWNEQGADVAVWLAPHFYETFWFYGAVAGALILAGAGTQRLRVRRLQRRERELSTRVDEALAEVKVLKGLLPICAGCKMIRDEQDEWHQIEAYIRQHSDARFTHGICPDCADKMYPGIAARIRAKSER